MPATRSTSTPFCRSNGIDPERIEGGHGTMLDIHGTYPCVTSSNTGAGAACTGMGNAREQIAAVVSIAKAWQVRPMRNANLSRIRRHLARHA